MSEIVSSHQLASVATTDHSSEGIQLDCRDGTETSLSEFNFDKSTTEARSSHVSGRVAESLCTDREFEVSLPWSEREETKRFFEDEELHSIFSRATAYLRAGVAVRFQGPAGMGKTAMALRVARDLDRRIEFITGHSRMTPDDLIGHESGQHVSRLEDKYIASVRRTETRVRKDWTDGALLSAMSNGHTLVYDEFTRAPPEANVALLSVLEEGVMAVSHPTNGRQIVRAHPEFRLILTSNPADYRGTNEAPDALIDRLVTFDFGALSLPTQSRIVESATGISRIDASLIVNMLSALQPPSPGATAISIRPGILIARLLKSQSLRADPSDPRFVQICADVLRGRLHREDTEAVVRDVFDHHLARAGLAKRTKAEAARSEAIQE